MTDKHHLLLGYKIVFDGDFGRELYPIPDDLEDQMDELYSLATKGKKSGIKKFTRLIEKYPQVPALKNYLTVLYNNMGKPDKAYEVNRWIVAEHPEYLFGKLNLAAEYYARGEYDKMPDLLGESMDLKLLYPHRDTFHVAEVTAFLKIAVLYFSAIQAFDQAETRLSIMSEIDPMGEDLEKAREAYDRALLRKNFSQFNEAKANRFQVTPQKMKLPDTTRPPEFIHPEIKLLYEAGMILDEATVAQLLALPRESLVADLNKVLADSIARYNFFLFMATGPEEGPDFLFHALMLLGELEARESLPDILMVLRQHPDFLDFYLADLLTEYIWQVLYKTGAEDLAVCQKFMREPGVFTYAKSEVGLMVCQVALHQPHRRAEVLAWYRELFWFFLTATEEDNVLDSELLGLLMDNVLDFHGQELLPEIKQLYQKGRVNEGVCGNIEDVQAEFIHSDSREDYRQDIQSIYAIYQDLLSWFDGDDPGAILDEYIYEPETNNLFPLQPQPKTGRNDPCPCGSGKKYKKCCMDK